LTNSTKNPEKAKSIALYAFEDGHGIEQYTELTMQAVAILFPLFEVPI
jgi:hypothetical protein